MTYSSTLMQMQWICILSTNENLLYLCVGPGIWGKIGTVVSILSLATDITKTTLGMLANVEKKIVVSIGNLEGVAWEGL